MEDDKERVDEMILAPLHLTTFQDGDMARGWKGMDREAMNRLHDKGYVGNPRSKVKSVTMTEEGARRRRSCLRSIFKRNDERRLEARPAFICAIVALRRAAANLSFPIAERYSSEASPKALIRPRRRGDASAGFQRAVDIWHRHR